MIKYYDLITHQSIELDKVELQKTLYDLFDDQKIELPHGCLSGSCGACLVQICEGNEYLSAPNLMELETIKRSIPEHITSVAEKVFRLSCKLKLKPDVKNALINFKTSF